MYKLIDLPIQDQSYKDIQVSYKNKIDTLVSNVDILLKANYNLEQRVYTIENENEKTATTRSILRKGINVCY